MVCTAILGLSFGAQFNPITVMVQNTLDPRDTGVGIATLMFLRLMAGAFGVSAAQHRPDQQPQSRCHRLPGTRFSAQSRPALLHIDQVADQLTPSSWPFRRYDRTAFHELYPSWRRFPARPCSACSG